MAIVKSITIVADTKAANNNLEVVSRNLNNIEKEANKASRATDDLTESVTKNGGAMGLLNELTGGLAQKFKDSYEAIQLSSNGLKGWRAAAVATGVGALVIGISLLIENWDELSAAIGGANKQAREFNSIQVEAQIQAQQSTKSIERLASVVQDETRSQLEREKALKDLSGTVKELNGVDLEQGTALLNNTNLLDRYIQSIQARAKAEAFAKIIAEKQAELLRKSTEGLQDSAKWYDKLAQAINPAINLQGARILKLGEEIDEEQKLIDQLQVVLEQNLRVAEAGEAQTAQVEKNEKRKVEAVKARVSEVKGIEIVEEEENFDRINREIDAENNKNKVILEGTKQRAKEEQQIADNLTEQAKRKAEFEVQTAQAVEDAKLGIAMQGLQLASQLATQGSDFAKGLAVAQVVLSSIQGAQNAFTTAALSPISTVFPAYPFIQAGLAAGFGAAQVQRILSVNPQSPSATTATSTVSTPSAGVTTPNIPSVTFGGNNIGNQIASAIQGQPIKAYVTTKDISSANELDRRVRQSATI